MDNQEPNRRGPAQTDGRTVSASAAPAGETVVELCSTQPQDDMTSTLIERTSERSRSRDDYNLVDRSDDSPAAPEASSGACARDEAYKPPPSGPVLSVASLQTVKAVDDTSSSAEPHESSGVGNCGDLASSGHSSSAPPAPEVMPAHSGDSTTQRDPSLATTLESRQQDPSTQGQVLDQGQAPAQDQAPVHPIDPPAAASGAGADYPSSGPSAHGGAMMQGTGTRLRLQAGSALEVDYDEHDDEAPSPRGRQPAFEAAKRTVALWPHEQQDRKQKLDRIGVLFRRDVRKALEGFPKVNMLWGGDDPVGFTDGDKAKIEEALGLKFVDAGGMAGGIKAVHEGLGLFLKFAFDHLGIYGSTRMAAKAAKREAAASRWVHAMDSVHVSTPLLECVDVRVRVAGGGHHVIRVQAFARVDVRGSMAWKTLTPDAFAASAKETTLRVGSSDGKKSIHWDEEQLEDVVKPLARHFGIAPYVEAGAKALVLHSYVASAASTARARTFLDFLQDCGMDPANVYRIREALDPNRMRLTEEDEKRLTPQEQELARAVYDATDRTGVNMDYRKPMPEVKRITDIQRHARHEVRLPFDVEVHYLVNGQRMVLDTHRLLIPDVVWMDWMKSDEAKPRVWAVEAKAASAGMDDVLHVHYGQLDSFCMSDDWTAIEAAQVQAALKRWSGPAGVTRDVSFAKNGLRRHMDTGCISAKGKDSSGQVAMVAIVACPCWYYCGNAAMTCLLPPEAAHRLRELEGEDAFEGLSPDLIMAGDAGAMSRARECIAKLYAKARAEVLDRYRDELAIEVCLTEDVDVQADPVVHRRALKRLMHSFGLGLRHVRLLVESIDEYEQTSHVCAALLYGTKHSVWWQSLDSLNRCTASVVGRIEQLAIVFATAGVVLHADESFELASHPDFPVTDPKVAVSVSSYQCVGTELAAAGGGYSKSPVASATALVQELAHRQRVDSTWDSSVFQSLSKVAQRSSGLELVHRACNAVLTEIANANNTKGAKGGKTGIDSGLDGIASCLESQGQYKEAMELYEQCRYIQETTLGKYHPSYATTLNNLAGCIGSQGQYGEAMELYEQSRQIEKTALGEQHPSYATTLNNMARGLETQGYHGEAMELFEQCRQIWENTLGKQHPHYAGVLNNMAGCLESLGQYNEAMELHEECRQILGVVLGKYHPNYAGTLHNMAACLARYGQYDEAMKMYEKCKQIYETALGKQHPRYATTLNNMAGCLDGYGLYGKAMELHEQCRQIRETVLGKYHPDYATTLNNMALCHYAEGQYGYAMELHEQCRQIWEITLGYQHPRYASSLNNMASCLESQGLHSKAMELFEQCSQIYVDALGKQHPEYASTLNNMAGCLKSQGKYSKAMELYEQCRQIQETALGKYHPLYATTLGSMAHCLESLGQCSKAMELHEQCRQILETALGKQHPYYATTLGNMATCLQSQGKYGEAIKLFEQCGQIKETSLGKQHPSYAATLNNMAGCLYEQGQYGEALELYEQCRQVSETALGKLHPLYIQLIKSMWVVCKNDIIPGSRTIEVLIHLEEALALQKGMQSQEYKDTVQELVGLLVDEGRMEEAQRYMDGIGGAT